MEFELTVREGAEAGRSFELRRGQQATVGRAPECDIRLDDQGVSRRHCHLEHRGRTVHVTDLDSANGTWIDGDRIRSGTLRSGQRIWLGPVLLECTARETAGVRADPRKTQVHFREGGADTVLRKVVDTTGPRAGLAAEPGEPAEEELEVLRRAQRNLATAHQVSKLLASARDLEGLFDRALEAVFDAINADRAALFLRREDGREGGGEAEDEESGGLELVAARKREEGEDGGSEEDGAGEGEGDGAGEEDELSVSRTVITDVLEHGVSTLSRDAAVDSRFEGSESIVAQRIRSVVCAPLATDDRVLGVLYADSRSVTGAFNENDLELLALIGNQAGVAIHRARLVAELEQFFFDTIRAIVATIDAKDGYTHRHSERVAAFARRIAREAGLDDEDELETVELSGLLHDIGKIGVREAILNKEGKLTDEEFAEIRKHPVHGVRILEHIHNPRFAAILPGVRHHHEKWDGSGYPDGIAGEDIPFLGRVLAVADVLDALSSDRSYRDAYTLDETVEVIREEAGEHFDPELAAAAVALHGRGKLQVERRDVDAEAEPPGLAVPPGPGSGGAPLPDPTRA